MALNPKIAHVLSPWDFTFPRTDRIHSGKLQPGDNANEMISLHIADTDSGATLHRV